MRQRRTVIDYGAAERNKMKLRESTIVQCLPVNSGLNQIAITRGSVATNSESHHLLNHMLNCLYRPLLSLGVVLIQTENLTPEQVLSVKELARGLRSRGTMCKLRLPRRSLASR